MRLIKTPLLACLLAGSVVVAKQYIPQWSNVTFLEESLFFLAGSIAGIRLPDIDLVVPGINHRSGITHSCLAVLLCWLYLSAPIAAGLALGMALHMASDLQPKAWTGGALIKFPLIGSIGLMSPIWLIANIIGCVAVMFEVVAGTGRLSQQLMLLVGLMCVFWYFSREEKKPVLPVMTLGFSVLLVNSVRQGVLGFNYGLG